MFYYKETSKSETKETSIPVNSIEHIIEPIKEHKDRNSKEAEELAKLLRIEILKRYPNNLGANKKDCIKRWANDIEKMIRLDKRTPENIKSAILWALNDSFWQKNIWSGANLRKHYDKLEAEAKAKFLKYGTITVFAYSLAAERASSKKTLSTSKSLYDVPPTTSEADKKLKAF